MTNPDLKTGAAAPEMPSTSAPMSALPKRPRRTILRSKTFELWRLLDEPKNENDRPKVRVLRLSAGQRTVLQELAEDLATSQQRYIDELPDAIRNADQAMNDMSARVERLNSDELSEEEQEELEEEIGRQTAALPVMGAAAVKIHLARIRGINQLKQLAVCVHSLRGNWSLVDEDLPPAPEWPPLDLDDPDDAISKRVELLRLIEEQDFHELHVLMHDFLASGGAGLPEDAKGN